MYENVKAIGFAVAQVVLAGIWITPLAILWFASLCAVRRRGDPARVGVAWIKATYPFWIISMLCQVVQLGLDMWIYDDYGWGPFGLYSTVREAISILFNTARVFQNVADTLLFIAFVELGSGFMFCLNGGRKTPVRKYLRYASFLWAAVLLALAFTILGIHTVADLSYYDRMRADEIAEAARRISVYPPIPGFEYEEYDQGYQQWEQAWEQSKVDHARRLANTSHLHKALNICLWISSLPTLGLASFVLHKAKNNILLKKTATLYLVSTILTSARLLISMAIYLAEYQKYDVLWVQEVPGYTDIMTYATSITEAFFNFVLMFITLTLLFTLAIRKRRGLWAKSQMAWDASQKLHAITANLSPGSDTSGYVDDGLQEQGFYLQPQQPEPSPPPAQQEPTHQPAPSIPGPASSPSPQGQQPRVEVNLEREPVGPVGQDTTCQRHLASPPSLPSLITTESDLPPDEIPLPIHETEGTVADGFQMQNLDHNSAAKALTLTAESQKAQHHHPIPTGTGAEADTVADGFQMQSHNSIQQQQQQRPDIKAAKFQQPHDDDTVIEESDMVADGFQMRNRGPSELPSYTESNGEATTAAAAGFRYHVEKEDQDAKGKGRARSKSF